MKIGLLECDHVLYEFRRVAGDYRHMFSCLLPELELVPFDVCKGQFPASSEDCEGWLCTGSKYSVYDEEGWILDLKAFVREVFKGGKKYVGVCYGHQMLAEALGGKVEKAKTGWNAGVHPFEMLEKEDWMAPFQRTLSLPMMCQDQVAQLPENSTLLARTPDCPVAMFRVGEHMLGIQGHPEFPPAYEEKLLESRRERIGSEKVNAALGSLMLPQHRALTGAWIDRFLRRQGKVKM